MNPVKRTFVVHDAGEVEIERDGAEVRVVEVRSSPGWNHQEHLDEDGAWKVSFYGPHNEAELEAEVENDRLKIEIEYEWKRAEDGVYQVGDAGEVQFSRIGDVLNLVEVRPNAGWDYVVVTDEDLDDLEKDDAETVRPLVVKFRSGEMEAEFEAEIEKGRLEVEVESEFYVDEYGG